MKIPEVSKISRVDLSITQTEKETTQIITAHNPPKVQLEILERIQSKTKSKLNIKQNKKLNSIKLNPLTIHGEPNLVPILQTQHSGHFEHISHSVTSVNQENDPNILILDDTNDSSKRFTLEPDPSKSSKTKETNLTDKQQITNNDKDLEVNLSSINIGENERKLLNKGLSFCPTLNTINEFELISDLDSFFRRLRLKEFFYGKDLPNTETNTILPPHKNNSTWYSPPNHDTNLETYITAVRNDILTKIPNSNKPLNCNLTKSERDALKHLKGLDEIIIKPADKGGAIVVMDKSKYIEEADRQLSNTDFYLPLRSDPTSMKSKQITDTLKNLHQQGHIDKRTIDFLTPKHSKPGCFYLLPKIHKPGNPGRPIVSGIGTCTENISAFVDYHIKHIPPNLPSYVKDTKHFLNIISKITTLPSDILLVTLDVNSLYTKHST